MLSPGSVAVVDWDTACNKWNLHTIGLCCGDVTRKVTTYVYMDNKSHVIFAGTSRKIMHMKQNKTWMRSANDATLEIQVIYFLHHKGQIQTSWILIPTFCRLLFCFVLFFCKKMRVTRVKLSLQHVLVTCYFQFFLISYLVFWITYPAPVTKWKVNNNK